jgi:flagellar hook-basal body complex protein FliE
MKIGQRLTLLSPNPATEGIKQAQQAMQETGGSFSDALTTAISDVNSLQNAAGQAIDQMVSGQASDLHGVMIAVEKARTSFDLLMEIRNKTLDAYREIMRTQV